MLSKNLTRIPNTPPNTAQDASHNQQTYIYSDPNLVRGYTVACHEYARLQNHLYYLQQQIRNRDEAYAHSASGSGYTYVMGSGGELIVVMNREPLKVVHMHLLPPYSASSFYKTFFLGVAEPLLITEADYHRDSRLIQALQEFHDTNVIVRKSTKTTATLLRGAFAKVMSRVDVPYYAGWRNEDNCLFYSFHPFSTHHTKEQTVCTDATLLDVDYQDRRIALAQLQQLFCSINAPEYSWKIFLIFNLGALYSLFDQLGWRFPLGFYLFCPSRTQEIVLTKLLKFYGDSPIDISVEHSSFVQALIDRKDQPVLIRDCGTDGDAAKNTDFLKQVISTGKIIRHEQGKQKVYSLYALPVILSSQASELASHPKLVVLDIMSEHISKDCFETTETVPSLSAYFAAVQEYLRDNKRQLSFLLEEDYGEAQLFAEEDLDDTYVRGFGILMATKELMDAVYSTHKLKLDLFPRGWSAELLSLLDVTASDSGCLISVFKRAVRYAVTAENVFIVPQSHCRTGISLKNTIIQHQSVLFFPTELFNDFCCNLKMSRPAMLHALAESNMLVGRPVNKSTKVTRLSIPNEFGQLQTIRAYGIAFDAFDEFGELALDMEVSV